MIDSTDFQHVINEIIAETMEDLIDTTRVTISCDETIEYLFNIETIPKDRESVLKMWNWLRHLGAFNLNENIKVPASVERKHDFFDISISTNTSIEDAIQEYTERNATLRSIYASAINYKDKEKAQTIIREAQKN